MYFKEKCSNKGEVLKHLSKTTFLDHKNSAFYHGRLYKTSPPAPIVIWESSDNPRLDHESPEWLTASEFQDTNPVFQDKVERLLALMRLSKKTVIYTGAGISTAAGVGQAARGCSKKSGGRSTDAQPTTTHMALAALKEKGLVHTWIQQNHDGLPQKAGYPQEDVVEIHGSWYDPSNPVVCYDGSLKPDLYGKMKDAADSADLVIVLGTSLSGLNSDLVAVNPSRRSLQGKSLGTVIINLQQTIHDGETSLRIFAETDKVFETLLSQLKMPLEVCPLLNTPEFKVLVPYSKNGKRSQKVNMYLDLSKGQKIKLNQDHNCQSAKQPVYMHIGSKKPHVYRGSVRQPGPGEGHVVRYSPKQGGWEIQIEGVSMLLGGWWLQAAVRGKLDSIPIVNSDPVILDQDGTAVGRSRFQANALKQESARLRLKSDSNESTKSQGSRLEPKSPTTTRSPSMTRKTERLQSTSSITSTRSSTSSSNASN